MKAVRYYGPQDVRVEHIAEPVAGNGQVKIKVSYRFSWRVSVADKPRLLGAFLTLTL
jgi:hypothetical protein